MSVMVGHAPSVRITQRLVDVSEVLVCGGINGQEIIEENVRANIAAGWQPVRPHRKQDREVVLLAGGPSLNAHLGEVIALRGAGAALVTTNGAYHWALDHALAPSAQIILDARESNARFSKPVVPGCTYLMASQVHPSVLAGLPRERTYLWHAGLPPALAALALEQQGCYFPIPGGSTVALRALPLLRMLGFWRFHVFGLDSCTNEGAHHAYPQPENDHEKEIPVECGGRVFSCTPTQAAQAAQFRDLVRMLGDAVELAVYGDGLIAHMIKTGAALAHEE